jgi:hypothetical protein
MKIFVETTYVLSVVTEVEIPDGAEVTDVDVKWGTIGVTLPGATITAQEADADIGNIDWKRPASIDVYASDASGDFPDYERKL